LTSLKDIFVADTGILCSLEEKGKTETYFVLQIRWFLFSVLIQSLELWAGRNPMDWLICACVLMQGQVYSAIPNTCYGTVCCWKLSGM